MDTDVVCVLADSASSVVGPGTTALESMARMAAIAGSSSGSSSISSGGSSGSGGTGGALVLDSASVASSSTTTATTATTTTTTTASASTTTGAAAAVVVDNVYLNGLHALRWLHLRNPSAVHRVSVRIKSTLGQQLAFQLTNENLARPSPPRLLPASDEQNASSPSQPSSSNNNNNSNNINNTHKPTPPPPLELASLPAALFDLNSDLTRRVPAATDAFEDEEPAAAVALAAGSVVDDFDPILDTPTPFKLKESQKEAPATNSAASPLDLSGSSLAKKHNHDHQFNQLFNYVNYIDQVDLEPNQTLPIVLAFLPDDQNVSSNINHRSSSPDQSRFAGLDDIRSSALSPESAPVQNIDNSEELHDFCEINGLIFFFAFIKPPADETANKTSPSNMSPSPASASAASASIPSPAANSFDDNNVLVGNRDSGSPDYQVTLKFRSRVCRSVLWTDIGETGISFDGCVVGSTYFKDFSIWNKSEIDLYWVLNTIDLSNRQNNAWLTFSDYDTAEPLDFSRPIPSYSQRRIRVTFKPTEPGEFNYDLQLENCNDSAGNTVQALVTADVKSAPSEELIRVESAMVDFGDCYNGTLYKQKIAIRNLSDTVVDLFMGVEDNVDLVFQLKAIDYGNSHQLHHNSSHRHANQFDETLDEMRRLSTSSSRKGMDEGGNGNRPILRTGRIRELAGLESASMSDLSNPSSSLNSRSSSPVTLQRLNSETLTTSSMDLLDLVGRSGTSGGREDSSSIGGADIDDLGIYGSSFGTMNSEIRRFGKDGDEGTRIEELSIRPGAEKTIELCFRPAKEHIADSLHGSTSGSGGRLVKRNFRVTIAYMKQGSSEKERKIIQCKARTCTSIIDVIPRELNFGDTDVGTLKSLPITVLNMSDLPAKVEVQFVSKVLHCYRGELIIPPKQTIEIKLDIYPRKVNPDYCKQITVVNINNRENDQIVEVKSTHIDKNRVTFHSLFYRILTPGSTNFMDFGSVVLNTPTVRTFSIENTSKKKLVLEITSSMAEEIQIFTKRSSPRISEYSAGGGGTTNLDSIALKEQLIDSLGDRKQGKRIPSDTSNNAANNALESDLSPTTTTPSNINEVTSSIIAAQSSFEAADSAEVKKPEYLDLASFSKAHGKEAKVSPGRKITTAMMASSSEGLQQLRKQFWNGHGGSTNADDEKELTASPLETVMADSSKGAGAGAANGNGSVGSNGGVSTEKSRMLVPSSSIGSQIPRSAPRNVQPRSSTAKPEPGSTGQRLNLDAFLKSLEEFTGAVPPLFSKQVSEEKYVKAFQLLQRELASLIKDGRLSPITVVELEPGAEISLVAIMTASGIRRPFVQTKAKKHDAKIFLRIVDFDRDIHQPQFEQLLSGDTRQIPVRELMIRCSLCRSMMELGQRNINFGYLDKNEGQTKTIVIRNKSEAPLFYYVRKSGSISSGDITIPEARIGLIRGYGKKEIDFIFEPSLAGPFQEKLTIENIQDRENDQTLTIKANIRQPSKFSIDTVELDFGPCLVGEFSGNIQHIAITNTSSKTRTFEVRIDDEKLDFRNVILDVRLEALGGSGDGGANVLEDSGKKKAVLSKEIMEKIEELEQKLKIYQRKRKDEKIKKATERLEKLRAGIMEDDIGKSKEEGEEGSKVGSEFDSPSTVGTLDSINTQPQNKSKYTAKPLVLAIEPRGTRSVAVHIRPMKKQTMMLSLHPTQDGEVCHGSIFVHEFKNTDVVKTVTFRSVPCFERKRFSELLVAEGHNMATMLQNPINNQIFDSEAVLDGDATHLVLSPVDETKPVFSLELCLIDIGRLEVNEKRECYFTMFNQTDRNLSFEIVPGPTSSLMVFKEPIGSLAPRESRRVYLHITPAVLGRQKHEFKVQCLETIETVTFTFYAILNSYLQFPSLNTAHSQLEFGPCYVNPTRKFAKVHPLDVVNASENEIAVSATSNLTQQCFIFSDKTLEVPATEIIMKPLERLTVFIALQPSVVKPSTAGSFQNASKSSKSITNLNVASGSTSTETALPTLTNEKLQVEASRTLIGGIRFAVSVLEPTKAEAASGNEASLVSSFYVLTHTVKFSAVIGVSNLAVDESYVDLGCSDRIGETFHSQITVVNRSPRLPLVFSVECECSNLKLEQYSGVIPALEDDTSSSFSSAMTSLTIPFSFTCSNWGYSNPCILIRNENNSQQLACVKVRFFADIGVTLLNGLATYCPAKILYNQDSVYAKTRFESKQDEGNSFPVIWWDDIYVSLNDTSGDAASAVTIQKNVKSEVGSLYERSFEVINNTEELLEISANASLKNSVRWLLSGGSGFVMNSNSDLTQTGNLLLQKHQKASVFVSVHLPPMAEEVCRRLSAGKNVTVRGLLLLENPEKSIALKAIDLIASYGLSIGSIEPNFVDLGRVGHLNNWEDVPFSFRVVNQSDCTLRYELELPDMVEIVRTLNDHGLEAMLKEIEGGKGHNVEAVLKPRKISNTKVGPHISQISVINLYNPRNPMIIEARSVLTLLDLKFERLVDGELVLPPLIYPNTATAAPCDNWFKIVNKSEQDLKFEIDFEPQPDLADFVHLDIVSRSANSHLNGILTLEPLGFLDVRIRAYVQDGARLSSNSEKSKFLTSSFGVAMGSLLITTKYQTTTPDNSNSLSTSVHKKMTQHIPLRCTIVEGPTFSVNDKKIKFTCFPVESMETPSSQHHQMKQIIIANHSRHFPLNFRVAIDYPLEFPLGTNLIEISPLGTENGGTVEPGAQQVLSIVLLKSNIGGISDSVKLHIYDTNSVSSFFQTVQISITESAVSYGNTLEALSLARHVDSERIDSLSESVDGITDNAMSDHELSFTEEPQNIDDDVSIADSFPNSNLSGPLSGPVSGPVDKLFSQYSQSNRSNISDHPARRSGYLINLRGCKRIVEGQQQASEPGGLFELDLGQQDISGTIVTKRIVLESMTNDRVSYKIRTLSDADRSWILISRAEGTLELRNTCHSINFNFVTSVRGMYSTYIIVENLENPLDSKIIRTCMAVVGKHNLRRNITAPSTSPAPSSAIAPAIPETNNVFDVIVAGLDPLANEGLSNDVITMNGLYYDMEYTARSIIIQNHETVPLEFFIKSNLKSNDPTELIFSLSRSAAKVFRSVIVQPESFMRVFLRYRPSLGDDEQNEKMDLNTANTIDEKVIEVSVNCRLVKDYQKTIYLRASCRRPQIYLPTQELAFGGKIRRKTAPVDRVSVADEAEKDWEIKFTEQCATLKIQNLLSDALDFEILNDSMYFGVDIVDESDTNQGFTRKTQNCSAIVDVDQSRTIRIFPVMSTLFKDVDVLRREKYFVEQITIYNRKRPSEKYWIVIKLSFGHLTQFQVATGSRHSYIVLEGQIIRLLREINANDTVFNVLVDVSTEANNAAEIYFRYMHIVEDLIYFGTREQAADYLQLAGLLFCGILKRPMFTEFAPSSLWSSNHRQWPPALAKWISLFLYLLSFFPHSSPSVESLRELSRSLVCGAPAVIGDGRS
ncbi:hypothetical protein BDR26DRAFT_729799 [Obelidium mucronatum]|nr:hypothetical protein BDR26DRAFT_729799 [Obelidium mucronatum]